MKDLEKIKSEDLAAQVQDANPGNFAIEQDVAAMVGATVPQPTEPSDDDARELGAQLLVFLRRALTPIQTALRTALAAIYAHLDSRCTDYTPAGYAPYQPLPSYDPMGTPPTPRTLPNLLTALTAFSARKISDLGDCPDGISFARLLCDSTAPVTEIVDDNHGWTWNKTVTFPAGVKKITANCRNATTTLGIPSGATDLDFPEMEDFNRGVFAVCDGSGTLNFPKLKHMVAVSENQNTINIREGKKLSMPSLENVEYIGNTTFCTGANLEEIDWPSFKGQGPGKWGGWSTLIGGVPKLKVLRLGKLIYTLGQQNSPNVSMLSISNCTDLLDIEIGEGTAISLLFNNWNPTNVLADADKTATFLQNFKEHIALRLTANGSGLTLTLSQAVFDTIWNQDGTPKSTDPDSVIYQINKIIKTDKHWSVNRA